MRRRPPPQCWGTITPPAAGTRKRWSCCARWGSSPRSMRRVRWRRPCRASHPARRLLFCSGPCIASARANFFSVAGARNAVLSALSVRNIVLIDQLDVGLDGGLTALTGETGAGKSILLDALTLALGGRGDAALVRNGADSGQVVALPQPPDGHPARVALRDNEIADDADLILRRVQYADGRTRAFINDQPVGAALMKTIGASLVE